MQRSLAASAAGLALVAAVAVPAFATPKPQLTVTVTGQRVSLDATGTVCQYRPCAYRWEVDGVRGGSTTRSYVARVAAGEHTVVLTVTERAFRNPTPNVASIERTFVVGPPEPGVPPVEGPPVEEPPVEEPPVEEPPAAEPPAGAPPVAGSPAEALLQSLLDALVAALEPQA